MGSSTFRRHPLLSRYTIESLITLSINSSMNLSITEMNRRWNCLCSCFWISDVRCLSRKNEFLNSPKAGRSWMGAQLAVKYLWVVCLFSVFQFDVHSREPRNIFSHLAQINSSSVICVSTFGAHECVHRYSEYCILFRISHGTFGRRDSLGD